MRHPFSRFLRVALLLALLPVAAHAAPSPDAERVAYIAWTSGHWQVWEMRPDGSEQRQVSRSAYDKARISWFPDGQALLVNAMDGRLFKLELGSGEETPIAFSFADVTDAVLSPDGERIAFSRPTGDKVDETEIFSVALSGGEPVAHTDMPARQHSPAWGGAGDFLYFVSGDTPDMDNIWRVALPSGTREQLSTGGLLNLDVAAGPQGALACSSNRTGDYDIWVRHADGTEQNVTVQPALDGGPTWAADGSALIFHSLRAGSLQLWKVDLPTRSSAKPKQLTAQSGGARGAVWWGAPGEGRRSQ